MPQYDLYHDTVKNAMIKDGWVITNDPFTLMSAEGSRYNRGGFIEAQSSTANGLAAR